jgi:hypothetical protein
MFAGMPPSASRQHAMLLAAKVAFLIVMGQYFSAMMVRLARRKKSALQQIGQLKRWWQMLPVALAVAEIIARDRVAGH